METFVSIILIHSHWKNPKLVEVTGPLSGIEKFCTQKLDITKLRSCLVAPRSDFAVKIKDGAHFIGQGKRSVEGKEEKEDKLASRNLETSNAKILRHLGSKFGFLSCAKVLNFRGLFKNRG